MKRDLSTLNPREIQDLRRMQELYVDARAKKQYDISDGMRTSLEAKGCLPPDYTRWLPTAENPDSRLTRAALRYVYGED